MLVSSIIIDDSSIAAVCCSFKSVLDFRLSGNLAKSLLLDSTVRDLLLPDTLVGDDAGLVNIGEDAAAAVDVDLFRVEEISRLSVDLVDSLEDFCGDRLLDEVLLGVDTGVIAFVAAIDILLAGVCSFLLEVDFLAEALDVFLPIVVDCSVDFRLFLFPFSDNRDVLRRSLDELDSSADEPELLDLT